MRNPYEFSLGQIELVALSERAPAEILHACRLLNSYLTARENGMRTYRVEQEQRAIRAPKDSPPKRRAASMDSVLLDSCALVSDDVTCACNICGNEHREE